MSERLITQKEKDAQYGEEVAENTFAATKGTAVIGHLLAAGFSIIKGAPELAPVFILTAAGIYKLSEKFYSDYHRKREEQIPNKEVGQIESPVPTNS